MILFDTHVLVWWASDPRKLSIKAKRTIAKEKGRFFVSSISIWEICLLVKKGRLKLTMDIDRWLEKVESLPQLAFISVDNRIASKSVSLPEPLHEDPADRMIIATALHVGASVITSDERIRRYSHVRSVW